MDGSSLPSFSAMNRDSHMEESGPSHPTDDSTQMTKYKGFMGLGPSRNLWRVQGVGKVTGQKDCPFAGTSESQRDAIGSVLLQPPQTGSLKNCDL
ncbi:hypothetical protein GH714_034873 [Hevea brasiliensis]|uniref:Uncharacterized protein n=1 Tax=Hevea brasiliensis TaxID=3981 RepID=A0A6A6MGU2_HEVBR|nr:hypothetical protein GH714_034873 [Hevea brasiliensis]